MLEAFGLGLSGRRPCACWTVPLLGRRAARLVGSWPASAPGADRSDLLRPRCRGRGVLSMWQSPSGC